MKAPQDVMSGHSDQQRREAAEHDAIAWVLRLDAPDASEADWLALQAWIEASAENRAAYDRAERVTAELRAASPALLRGHAAPPLARRPLGRRAAEMRQPRRRMWAGVSGLVAAAAALVMFVAVRQPAQVPADVYQTPKGEARLVALADGSSIHLNSGSRITVRLERKRRFVELTEGEAAFDVAKDASRPFVIAAGERDIRVVGTEFDVLRHDGRLRVTVRRGVVAVQSPDAGRFVRPVLLNAGDQLDHRAGSRTWAVQRVDPNAAFAWRQGDLVYSDRPLDEVVDDLNRYFATPVRVEGDAARLRFSGVLKIDDEVSVVRRLQAFLPIAAAHDRSGVTLRLRSAPG